MFFLAQLAFLAAGLRAEGSPEPPHPLPRSEAEAELPAAPVEVSVPALPPAWRLGEPPGIPAPLLEWLAPAALPAPAPVAGEAAADEEFLTRWLLRAFRYEALAGDDGGGESGRYGAGAFAPRALSKPEASSLRAAGYPAMREAGARGTRASGRAGPDWLEELSGSGGAAW